MENIKVDDISAPTKIIENKFNSLWNYELANVQDASITISNVIIGIIFFVIGLYVSKILSQLSKKKLLKVFKLNRNSAVGIEKFIQYILITVITLTSLDIANIPLSGLTFIGGALAIGIGFGSQNILNNFISGLIIMIESPIRVGDIVEVEDKVAKVTNIGGRCVHLETFDNIDLLVPNSEIIQGKIINRTLNDNIMRVKNTYKICHGADVERAIKCLNKILADNIMIDHSRSNGPFVDKIELTGVKIDLYYHIVIGGPYDAKIITDNINRAVLKKFTAEKIKLMKSNLHLPEDS